MRAGLTWLTSPAISATDSFVEAALRRPVEKCLPWPGSVELVVVRSAPVQAVRLARTVYGLDGSASDDHKLDGSRSQTAFLDHPPMTSL